MNKEMPETKHTPLPWKAHGGDHVIQGVRCVSIFSLSNADTRPATAHGNDAEQAEANSDLIIRCVNTHAGLLEASTALINELAQVKINIPVVKMTKLRNLCDAVIEAIDKAKG